jgi:hypothetical protein
MNLIKVITAIIVIVFSGCTTKQATNAQLSMQASEADSYYAKAFTLINDSRDKEAFKFAERAAILGHAQAQYLVGYMLHKGTTGVISISKARDWYEKAAAQGVKEAQFNLGVLADKQSAIPRHFATATERHKREAREKAEEVNTVFIGHLLGYAELPLIQPASCFEPNVICMNHYVTYKVKVKEVIAGETLSGTIFATRLQHGPHFYSENDLSLFVVTKIKKEEDIKLLKAGYFLREHVPPSNNYCLRESLDNYITELKESVYPGCMPVNLFYEGIKQQFLEDVANKVESSLEKRNLLISVDQGVSVKGKFVSDEQGSENCPDYYNLDKYKDDPLCHSATAQFEVSQFIVKKGFGDLVNTLLKDELADTKLNLQSVEMKVVIREASDSTIVEWYYLVKRNK